MASAFADAATALSNQQLWQLCAAHMLYSFLQMPISQAALAVQ